MQITTNAGKKIFSSLLVASVLVVSGCSSASINGVSTEIGKKTELVQSFTENTEMTELEISELKKEMFGSFENSAEAVGSFSIKTEGQGKDVSVDMLLMHPQAARRAKFWGIKDANELLEKGSSPTRRWFLTRKLGGLFPSQAFKSQILFWVVRADLLRIKNVSIQDSFLLAMAGVTSTPHLAIFNNPIDQMALKVQLSLLAFQYGYPIPSLDEIESWTKDATTLPPVLY